MTVRPRRKPGIASPGTAHHPEDACRAGAEGLRRFDDACINLAQRALHQAGVEGYGGNRQRHGSRRGTNRGAEDELREGQQDDQQDHERYGTQHVDQETARGIHETVVPEQFAVGDIEQEADRHPAENCKEAGDAYHQRGFAEGVVTGLAWVGHSLPMENPLVPCSVGCSRSPR